MEEGHEVKKSHGEEEHEVEEAGFDAAEEGHEVEESMRGEERPLLPLHRIR